MRIPSFSWIGSIGLVAVILLALPLELHAYTDPGTGALLMQMLGGSIVGFLYYFRRIFRSPGKRVAEAGRQLTKE